MRILLSLAAMALTLGLAAPQPSPSATDTVVHERTLQQSRQGMSRGPASPVIADLFSYNA